VNAGTVNLSGSLSGTTNLNVVSGAALNLTGAAAYNKINYLGTSWTIAGALNNQMTTGTVAQTLAPTINLNGGSITGMGVTTDNWGDFAISANATINITGTATMTGIWRGNGPTLTLNTSSSSDSLLMSGILGNNLGVGTLSLTKSGQRHPDTDGRKHLHRHHEYQCGYFECGQQWRPEFIGHY